MQQVQEARRLDAKLPSRLQWHRADLLGRVGGRLEVYQRAMTSYAKMTRDFSRVDIGGAGGGELEAYRQWMESKAPIAVAETGFLRRENEGDLVTIKPSPPMSSSSTADYAVNGDGDGSGDGDGGKRRKRKGRGVGRRRGGGKEGSLSLNTSAAADDVDINDDKDSSDDDDDDEFLDTDTKLDTSPSNRKHQLRKGGSSTKAGSSAAERQRQKTIILPLALLATIVVFKVVPHVFARLVISSMIAVAAASMLGMLTGSGAVWKGWRKREGVVYVGVLVALALLVR